MKTKHEHVVTRDINLISFILTQGFEPLETVQNGNLIEFIFSEDTRSILQKWQFSPTEEMLSIQEFLKNKDKVLSFIHDHRGRR